MKLKEKVGFKQYGKSLVILTQEEIKGANKFKLTIDDANERKETVSKIKNLVTLINKTESKAQVQKKSTTLVNIFLKNRKEIEKTEVVKKAKAKLIQKTNKKTVKSVSKKSNALEALEKQIEALPKKDKETLMQKLKRVTGIAKVESSKPKPSYGVSVTRRGEY